MFLSGVNHIFYHGTCYSPDEAAWPGWLFYASTEMNPRNSIWHDVPALNAYIARCQSVLQSGQPDNDMLLYWPIYDFWNDPTNQLLPFAVEMQRFWFKNQPIGGPPSNFGITATPSITSPTANCKPPGLRTEKSRCPAEITRSLSCRNAN